MLERLARDALTLNQHMIIAQPAVETYFNTALLPPIALVRAVARQREPRNGRTDYQLTGGALNDLLALPMRGEAALIARGARLPAGVSIGMVCEAA